MKLSEWAKQAGISYRTAWRWFKAGTLPCKAKQMASGTIIIEGTPTQPTNEIAIYARVSSSDQKNDLNRQLARLLSFANENGFSVRWTEAEIGSGLGNSTKIFQHEAKVIKLSKM